MNKAENNCTVFKTWCVQNEIEQKDIHNATKISYGTIHHTWNDGKASPVIIQLLSVTLKIQYDLIEEMITTFDKDDKLTAKIIKKIKKFKKLK